MYKCEKCKKEFGRLGYSDNCPDCDKIKQIPFRYKAYNESLFNDLFRLQYGTEKKNQALNEGLLITSLIIRKIVKDNPEILKGWGAGERIEREIYKILDHDPRKDGWVLR